MSNRPANEDAARLDALTRRFWKPVRRFFERRTPESDDRDDLTQEVFSRLVRRGDLGGIDHLDGYVFQTAASVLTDHLRRGRVRHVRDHVEADDTLQSDTDFSPERVLLGKEAIILLEKGLAELPERTRAVFMLYHFDDLPHRQIAARLGVSLSTVEKDMARANRHLLDRLRGE